MLKDAMDAHRELDGKQTDQYMPSDDENQQVDSSIEAEHLDLWNIRRGDRILAALAYVGLLPFLIIASRPGPTFIRKHLRVAASVHLVRIIWVGAIFGFWFARSSDGEASSRVGDLTQNMLMIVVSGIPWFSAWSADLLPWLLPPVILTWIVSSAGFVLALNGKTADFHAFIHANWTDPVRRRRFLYTSPDEEREMARRARDRQLERLQKSSKLIQAERTRRDEMSDIELQIDRLMAQREYYDQLLALGEISHRRYNETCEDIDEQIRELRGKLSGLTTRVATMHNSMPERLRVTRLSRPRETSVEALAIVTSSGIPLFAYGQFQIDEALVTGMLNAFDSLSEEAFGSRVHKTSLAEGQVLYFAHGEHVLIMGIFDDEPAPRQIEQLRTMLRQFESANEGPLERDQLDPTYLHEVPIPFRFVDEMPRGHIGADTKL